MEIIHEPPSTSSFTPLSEHQSRTPSSFYSSTPVLYHHSADTKLIILEYETLASSPLAKLADPLSATGAATNGDTDHSMAEEVIVEGVDVWVTSEYELLSKTYLISSTCLIRCLHYPRPQEIHPLPPVHQDWGLDPLSQHLPARHPEPHLQHLDRCSGAGALHAA